MGLLLSVIEMTGIGSSRFAMTFASWSAMMTVEAESEVRLGGDSVELWIWLMTPV